MLCGVAFVQATRAEMPAAAATAEAAVELAGPLRGAGAAAAESTLGWILIVAGDGDRGYPLLLRHAERGDAAGRTLEGLRESAALGMFAGWMEDYGTARRELERTVALARDQGLVSSLPLALSALGELEFRVGNWNAARLDAEEALRFAEDAGEFLHYGHNVLLLLDAVAGNAERARANADRALTIAARSGSRALAMHAHAGLGLLELGLDRPEAAIVQLSHSREIAARGGVKEPNYIQWMPDLIESQIRAGLEREARGTLQEFEAQARRTGRRWALASAARCQGRWPDGRRPTRSSPRRTGSSPRCRRRSSSPGPSCAGASGCAATAAASRPAGTCTTRTGASNPLAPPPGSRRRPRSCVPAAAGPGADRALAATS